MQGQFCLAELGAVLVYRWGCSLLRDRQYVVLAVKRFGPTAAVALNELLYLKSSSKQGICTNG